VPECTLGLQGVAARAAGIQNHENCVSGVFERADGL
jgi:hypothetical protein